MFGAKKWKIVAAHLNKIFTDKTRTAEHCKKRLNFKYI